MTNFEDFCRHQHDVECNHVYDKKLKIPYSFHIMAVKAQVEKFYSNNFNFLRDHAIAVALGHDLIEDARLTYNDVAKALKVYNRTDKVYTFIPSVVIADAIYNCSESLGKNRDERHDDAFYDRVTSTDLSLFVKLCDISANVTYGVLMNSDMLQKYREEFPAMVDKIASRITVKRYESFVPIIKHIQTLLDIVPNIYNSLA